MSLKYTSASFQPTNKTLNPKKSKQHQIKINQSILKPWPVDAGRRRRAVIQRVNYWQRLAPLGHIGICDMVN